MWIFFPRAEVIAEYAAPAASASYESSAGEVLALLRRRPCSLQDVAKGLAIHPAQAAKHIEALLKQKTVRQIKSGANSFYKADSPGK